MTKRIAAVVVMLVTGLPGLAASSARSIGMQNQFHIQPAKGKSKFADRVQAEFSGVKARSVNRNGGAVPAATAGQAQSKMRPHRNGNPNPPVSTIGFVSATQIPAGGAVSTNAALEGDFNGDGKNDLLTLVVNQSGGTNTISVAVALGNGDGTFQAPVLTAVPSNSSDAYVVGDLNGDGKTDVVIVHLPGSIGPSASFDVMLSNGDGTFTVGNNYVITANQLAGGILYDQNGDGKLDVVVVDASTPGNVWTLLGNGDGTFQAPTAVTLNGRAGANLVFGDFNHDGLLDFADNDYATGELTVYRSQPGGAGYDNPALYSTPNGVYDAYANAVGDLNSDGRPEIVSANFTDNTITVYVNKGDGTFLPGVYYAVVTAPSTGSTAWTVPTAVTIADVNGDGKADVITTDDNSGDLVVLLGNGDGTVKVPSVGYATGGYPYTAAIVADFNGDGLPDLVVTDAFYSFVYMKGYGDGTFRAATDFYTPTTDNGQSYGWDVATGDFNGDGIPDVVIGNWYTDATVGITVFLSRGDGSLKPGVNYGSGGAMAFVAVADFNKDGKLDIAAVDHASGMVQIFTGNGDGTFTAGQSIATGDTDSQTIVAADLNGDGWPDLVVANNNGGNFGVIMNDGTGAFLPIATTTLNNPATVVAAADVNGDGKMDLVLPEPACGCVGVLLGNGDGTFQTENNYGVGSGPNHVAIGDLNNDGKADLAVTIDDPTGQGIAVALGNGDGTFQTANTPAYPTSLQSNVYNPIPSYVKMVDLDGDGNQDLVYTNLNYGTVGILYGLGNGTFYDPVEYPTASYSPGLALADVNGDGTLDVVTASNDGTSLATVLLNSSGSASSVGSSLNPAAVTQTITFTATVGAKVRGVATVPTGMVTFYDGSTSLGSAALSSGVASFPTSLAIGTHNITAQYAGGANFHGSTSSVLSQVVTITPDSTTLMSSANPAAVGQSVTFTATVAAGVTGVTTAPTGNVTFFDGATALGPLTTLSGGVATYTTSSLAAGTHSITAQYAGDANFSGSTSSALSQVVAVPDYTLSADPPTRTVSAGGIGTYVITLTPSTGYNGTVTFSCGTLPTKTTCGFSNPGPTLTPTGNNAALTTTLTLTTTGSSRAALTAPAGGNPQRGGTNLLASLSGVALFGLVLAGSWKKKHMGIMLGVVVLGMMIMMPGCGGGSSTTPPPNTGTPPGTYTVTVTASGTAGTNGGNTAAHPLNVTLTVQ